MAEYVPFSGFPMETDAAKLSTLLSKWAELHGRVKHIRLIIPGEGFRAREAVVKQRVVITGGGGLCPIGKSWEEIRDNLHNKVSGISVNDSLAEVTGMNTRLVAAVPDFVRPAHYPRRKVRSMGRTALLATRATELALQEAGLIGSDLAAGGRMGIAYGSTTGSPPAIETYARHIGVENSLHGITAAQFVKLMSHTCAANLAQFFEIMGRLIPTCSACTSGSQGIGFAYEAVKWGLQDVMIAGGSEELHVICTAVFDIMNATSTRNDDPLSTPRPFDTNRDGLVVGEGAATLIVEELEHARRRGAPILAEVVGFATNSDGRHIVNPCREDIARVQREALADAGLAPSDIGYINAHGTATEVGDIAESQGTADVFGTDIAISSLKSYMGHTLGACGALEAWISILMLKEGWLAPTINLENPDPLCAPLDYITEVRETDMQYMMSNNFAFGGVNTSLIFKRV